jgi:hypothetical protein
MDEIRNEINNIEKSAERIKALAAGNNAVKKNASIILSFVYILRFLTPSLND